MHHMFTMCISDLKNFFLTMQEQQDKSKTFQNTKGILKTISAMYRRQLCMPSATL